MVATDFANGFITVETGLYALEQNRLLLSACHSTLGDIIALTPENDEEAQAGLSRLLALLNAEDALLSALTDLFGEPNDERARRVEEARAAVEQMLTEYTGGGA